MIGMKDIIFNSNIIQIENHEFIEIEMKGDKIKIGKINNCIRD